MATQETAPSSELVELTRLACAARSLSALVSAQYELRAALRRTLASHQWSHLDDARRELAGSPSLAAQFMATGHRVLETPELSAREPGARWHGVVLAIPVAITCRAGTLLCLPQPLALALRESLQARFPHGTGVRLVNRPVPQLVAHTMGTRALYELIEELASGERGAAADLAAQPPSPFVPQGRSLGRHYFFAMALSTRPEQIALEMAGDSQAESGLVKWAAAQTERITSDFAERGWPLLMRVSAPQRLSEVLSSPLVVSDVRELDGVLDHLASRHRIPVAMLRASLAVKHGDEAGLLIAITDRAGSMPRAHVLYRLAALGTEAGAYRVAVRLGSADVEVATADENLRRAVQRAVTLASAPAPAETPPRDVPGSRRLGMRTLRSRFSRSLRHPS